MSVDPRLYELLAHRPPMMLLTRIIELGEKHAVAEVDVSETTTFFQPPAGVPSWVALEYMAQTVGLVAGDRAERDGEGGAPQGYLLGTRKLTCSVATFPAGVTLRMSCTEELFDDRGLAVYNCRLAGPDCNAVARLTLLKRLSE